MRSLIDITDFSVEEIDELLHTACDISENGAKYADSCRGKKLATLFFEPSTAGSETVINAVVSDGIIKPFFQIFKIGKMQQIFLIGNFSFPVMIVIFVQEIIAHKCGIVRHA